MQLGVEIHVNLCCLFKVFSYVYATKAMLVNLKSLMCLNVRIMHQCWSSNHLLNSMGTGVVIKVLFHPPEV